MDDRPKLDKSLVFNPPVGVIKTPFEEINTLLKFVDFMTFDVFD